MLHTHTHTHTHSLRKILFLRENLSFKGNWLLTSPNEKPSPPNRLFARVNLQHSGISSSQEHLIGPSRPRNYKATHSQQETLGTVENCKDDLEVEIHQSPAPPSSGTASSSHRRATTHSMRTNGSHFTGPNSSNLVAHVYMSEEEEHADL